jgi:hypothetical protein
VPAGADRLGHCRRHGHRHAHRADDDAGINRDSGGGHVAITERDPDGDSQRRHHALDGSHAQPHRKLQRDCDTGADHSPNAGRHTAGVSGRNGERHRVACSECFAHACHGYTAGSFSDGEPDPIPDARSHSVAIGDRERFRHRIGHTNPDVDTDRNSEHHGGNPNGEPDHHADFDRDAVSAAGANVGNGKPHRVGNGYAHADGNTPEFCDRNS